MYTIAVFKARSEAIGVYSYLKKRGIASATVSTPSHLKMGCGLSVVFPTELKGRVAEAIERTRAKSFVGFFAR